jgi:hypothetical protein
VIQSDMAKFKPEAISVAIMTILSIAGLIALLGGGSWYSFKITSNGSTQSTTTFYLDKYVVASGSGSSNFTITYASKDANTGDLAKVTSLVTATNCVSSGQAAMGLTIGNLALHAIFLALFVAKGGSMSDMKFRNVATGCLVVGLILEIVAVAYFDSNTTCAKGFYDSDLKLGLNASLTAAA